MAANKGTLFLLAGAGALLLMSGKKKKRPGAATKAASENDTESDREDLDEEDEDGEEIFDTDATSKEEEEEGELEEDLEEAKTISLGEIIGNNMDPDGKARLGKLYQIKPGDTPLEVCREALFGNRAATSDPIRRQAAKDLLVRIDCGPWNQACYAVPIDELKEGHANIDDYWTQKGVSFNPIYKDNLKRILNGQKPTSGKGSHFALIWIPMINLDLFDMKGEVSTQGIYHEDTIDGMGGYAIDPPQEILNLEFQEVSSDEVGCDLPDGNYRRPVIANG